MHKVEIQSFYQKNVYVIYNWKIIVKVKNINNVYHVKKVPQKVQISIHQVK
jgi:hypothetical protein